MSRADLIREGLAKFAGVGRRFDIKGVVNDITVIDDYGHHPAEIRATLEAARGCKFNRLLVLFQPHRYTRTQHLWDEFCRAFNQADVLVLTDIYAASEAPIPGITSEALATSHSRRRPQECALLPLDAGGIEFLLREARPGDAILTIGAGNVSRASNELMVLLGTEHRVSDGLTMRIEDPKIARGASGAGSRAGAGAVAWRSLTSLGIGGTTDLLRIEQHEAIPDLLNLLERSGIPHKFLGGGSNLLVGDGELPLGRAATGQAGAGHA